MADPVLFTMARMTSTTTGTGSSLTLVLAVSSFITFFEAGVIDQMYVRYIIEDTPGREYGAGTYTHSSLNLTRDVINSTAGLATRINMSGNAQVYIGPVAEDIVTPLQVALMNHVFS